MGSQAYYGIDSFSFILGVFTGFLLSIGVVLIKRMNGREIVVEKFYAALIVLIWLAMHMFGFFISDKSVPSFFDFVGGATAGHLLGLDLITPLAKLIKRK